MRWFSQWERLGYTAEYGASGHYKVRGPDGSYVATISGSPTNPEAPRFEVERILRRHVATTTPRAGDERKSDDG